MHVSLAYTCIYVFMTSKDFRCVDPWYKSLNVATLRGDNLCYI